MSIEKIDKKLEEIDSYLKHLDEIETNEYWDEMFEENEYEEKIAKGLVYLGQTENTKYRIGENKVKEKSRIVFYTKFSKGIEQSNLLTVIKEYYVGKEITFAKILFEI